MPPTHQKEGEMDGVTNSHNYPPIDCSDVNFLYHFFDDQTSLLVVFKVSSVDGHTCNVTRFGKNGLIAGLVKTDFFPEKA